MNTSQCKPRGTCKKEALLPKITIKVQNVNTDLRSTIALNDTVYVIQSLQYIVPDIVM